MKSRIQSAGKLPLDVAEVTETEKGYSRIRANLALQHNQLIPEHRVLCLKAAPGIKAE